jgi:prepilin-type N-terminal cleavage/methylation domain-containing protein
MNMILKKQIENRGKCKHAFSFPSLGGVAPDTGVAVRRRRGFTLVEVIVVLVILAILAAIAIPALTGYIDKAQDKKYIADARNAIAATRAVLGEEYANGTLGKGLPASGPNSDYLTAGGGTNYKHLKNFSFALLSSYANTGSDIYTGDGEDWVLYTNKAAEYIGLPTVVNNRTPGFFEIDFFAPKDDASYNIRNAPAFMYRYYPEGSKYYEDIIVVTYGLAGVSEHSDWWDFVDALKVDDVTYDPNAGYKVFHTVIEENW